VHTRLGLLCVGSGFSRIASKRALLLIVLALATFPTGSRIDAVERSAARMGQPADAKHPEPLAIGSPAPDFRLPGVDGRIYSLSDFTAGKALVVIFTAVHCPTAEVYEKRIKALVADYQNRGVSFVVIQPNSPKALRLDEMGYTDLGDSLDDMKERAKHRAFNFPFLFDGDTQDASRLYGPSATPHVFVFDADRKLRYQGRVDSNPREAYAKVPDARNAIDAVLSGGRVPVEKTPTVGCSIKWLDKHASHDAELASIDEEAVPLERITPDALKALRENPSGKTMLVNFWATWCAPCKDEFPDLQKTWRMYRNRPFQLVTVSINYPDEEKGVRRFLESQHASSRNMLSDTMDPYELMRAFDPEWNGSVPFSMIIGPDGKVLHRENGRLDILKARRTILASFPDDDYVGQNAYWTEP
jgi:peroxiredoxin